MVSDFNRFLLKRRNDLVTFLKTLTGESPPDHLLSKPLTLCKASKVRIPDRGYGTLGIGVGDLGVNPLPPDKGEYGARRFRHLPMH